MTVKNAPYSGEEVTETNQMLADGTRIHRENRTTVYRDNEGRTRRETPDNITITDPVANVTYLLNPKILTWTETRHGYGTFTAPEHARSGWFSHQRGEALTFAIHTSSDGPATITVNGDRWTKKRLPKPWQKPRRADRRRPSPTNGTKSYRTAGPRPPVSERRARVALGGWCRSGAGNRAAAVPATRVMMRRTGNGESLGKQMVEGVNADGMRETTTIPAGAIGNDRPIAITNESWYSEELQMTVMSKRSDPRTGDETFRLTNIRRGEPGAYLFQAPSGYQISEPKRDPLTHRRGWDGEPRPPWALCHLQTASPLPRLPLPASVRSPFFS